MKINSASQTLKANFSRKKLINKSLDALINNFFEDVADGTLRAKSVEDLNRLINMSMMLKAMDSDSDGENSALILDSLGLTEDDSLKEMYNRMLNHMNKDNDDANRE